MQTANLKTLAELEDKLFHDIKMGKSLEIEGARSAVTSMADSILRHPDALVLLASLGNKDRSLVTHALSVCTLSLALGRSLGFETDTLIDLGLGALLHDIGEMKIPEQVLDNVANASEEERALVEIPSRRRHGKRTRSKNQHPESR